MLKKIQTDLTKGALNNPKQFSDATSLFRRQVGQLNDYYVQSVRAKSATQAFTESLIKQDIGLFKAIKSRRMFNDVLREQYALQKMTAVQYTRDAAGNLTADIIVPRGVSQRIDDMTGSLRTNIKELMAAKRGTAQYTTALDVLKMRVGLFNQSLDSVAHKMINWGKNTQWAGRQLTVGLSVPLAAFAAIAGKAAYDANKELTRIVKVYDFASKGGAQMAESQALQNMSMKNGIQVARQYGAALKDTLDVEAQLAATGLKSQELLKSTAEVQRATILGEMDKQDTIKATISLQAILHHSASELADDFNYMNAVENATNLTMQDFVQAIPRALGPLSQLGVSLQDMGVLLAAMKSRGIEAAQGANALKSGLNRVLNPAESVKESLRGFGINIDEIVSKSGGNFMMILQELSDQMAGLDNLARQKIIGKLFGTYQFSRVNAIIQGLQDIHDNTTQVGRAFQVSGQDATKWGQIATTEMDRIRNSASGKFKRAIESIKAQFAELGGPFLEFATVVVKVFTGIIAAFNKLPHGFKVVMIGIALIAAAAGPLIMLAGLFGNLVGQALNMFHTVLNLGSSFKAMTAQERAAEMLGKQHSYVWRNQASSAQALAGAIQGLTMDFQMLAKSQMQANAAAGLVKPARSVPLVYTGKGATGYSQGGRFASYSSVANSTPVVVDKSSPSGYRAGGKFASKEQFEAYNKAVQKAGLATAGMKRDWSVIGSRVATLAVGVGLMGAMVAPSNQLLSNIINTVFIAGLLGPTLIKGLKAAGITSFFANMFKGLMASRMLAPLTAGLGRLLPMAAGIAPALAGIAPQLAIAAAASGFLFFKIRGDMKKAREEQDKITNSAKDWSDHLGYVYNEQARIADISEKNAVNAESMARAIINTNPALTEELRHLRSISDEAARAGAINEGIKAFQHGASLTQAQEVVRTSLRVAGFVGEELDRQIALALRSVDFNNSERVFGSKMDALSTKLQRIVENDFSEGKWEKVGGFLLHPVSGDDGLNAGASEAAKNMAVEFLDSFTATMDGRARRTMWLAITGALNDAINDPNASHDERNRAREAADKFLNEIKAAFPDLKVDIDTMMNPSALHAVGAATMTVSEAQRSYTDALAQAEAHGIKYNKQLKLRILNHLRAEAGLGKAKSLEEGFAEAVDGSSDALVTNSGAINQNNDAMSKLTDVMKSAYSGAVDASMSAADTIASYWQQSQEDSLNDQQEAQEKAFDKEERGITHHFNVLRRKVKKRFNEQIHDLNQQINREQRMQDRRNAMFEAEQERLQRLASTENSSIDFNVALNTGQFDEAAKIFNNMQAEQDKNAIDDAQKKSQTASERRIASLQKELKQVTRLRDARLKALDREEEAEKKALDRRKERYQDEQDAKEESLQRELDLRRMYLDLELAAIRANVPKNKREYDKQIAQIEGAYQRYGVRLQDYGDRWGKFVGDALDSNVKTAAKGLRDEIDWQHISHGIANKFAKGAFGLNINQFAKWLTTGKMPKGGLHPDGGGAKVQQPVNPKTGLPYGADPKHGGGTVGSSNGTFNLAGRSPSSQLYRDEVLVRAQRGEYVIDKNTHAALGTDFFDGLKTLGRHAGGPVGIGGLGMAMMAGMMSGAVTNQIRVAGKKQQSAGFGGGIFGMFANGVPGVGSYQNINDDAMRNAAIILAVGKAMGATGRDLITSIAVALVESHLHNLPYGDRDSLGLFQQRPSQGWGTPQQIMDPKYSAHAFFASLMRYPQRAQWPIGKAAQIVQRSAYPEIYYGTVPQARKIVSQTLPSLSSGGNIKYDNTIANLHKKETVLTAPLSQSLQRGIQNLENGGGDRYYVTLDLRGATIDKDVDIEKAVYKAIDKKESKKGRSRKIGDKD